MRGFGVSGAQNTLILLDGRALTDIDLTSPQWSSIPLAGRRAHRDRARRRLGALRRRRHRGRDQHRHALAAQGGRGASTATAASRPSTPARASSTAAPRRAISASTRRCTATARTAIATTTATSRRTAPPTCAGRSARRRSTCAWARTTRICGLPGARFVQPSIGLNEYTVRPARRADAAGQGEPRRQARGRLAGAHARRHGADPGRGLAQEEGGGGLRAAVRHPGHPAERAFAHAARARAVPVRRPRSPAHAGRGLEFLGLRLAPRQSRRRPGPARQPDSRHAEERGLLLPGPRGAQPRDPALARLAPRARALRRQGHAGYDRARLLSSALLHLPGRRGAGVGDQARERVGPRLAPRT